VDTPFPPCVRQASFADFEAFAAAVPGYSLAAAPLRPGAFSSATTEFRLGDLVLQTGRSTPLVTAGGVDPGAACIALPLGRAGTLRLNGRAVGPGDVALYAPGADHVGAIPHDTAWALLTLPAAAAEALLEPPRRSPLRRPGAHAVLRADRRTWARAASLVRSAARVAAADPGVFEAAEARRALRDELLEALRDLVAGPRGGARPRALRDTPARRWIVRAAEDLLRADPRRAIGTEEVCAALGVSPSALRAAIEVSFAVDPERYLRLRRLALARAALRSAEPRRASVEEVAAAHGFWDAQAFARQFRELFGEAPALASRRGAG
jgi:AraC family transcriptional regulator, ethanolamine operon transcriptional activator